MSYFTRGQEKIYKELCQPEHYLVYHHTDARHWLMKGREKVRALRLDLHLEDLTCNLLISIHLGKTTLTYVRDSFDTECFLQGNLAKANLDKEYLEACLKLLRKHNTHFFMGRHR